MSSFLGYPYGYDDMDIMEAENAQKKKQVTNNRILSYAVMSSKNRKDKKR